MNLGRCSGPSPWPTASPTLRSRKCRPVRRTPRWPWPRQTAN
ncbi:unnamed protein product [Spirodela intermedia]|uniref:Uncharacterized protein n=1 Tax=Spirodela intermedia TaxID=51605 RepID=A0A7I8JGN0_SPIIN|nr:unnamed protein product [Spirodela intermedia]CAA6669307.1 unnamed protein product [Spirodela intermedia]